MWNDNRGVALFYRCSPMTDVKVLTVQTPTFGEIEVSEEKIFFFSEGIPGFPQVRRFAILESAEHAPFRYLQSLGSPPIALLIINPFLLHPGYECHVADRDMQDLQTDRPEDISVYAVATIPEDPTEATINLMAPILINEKNRCGKQVILLDSQYSVRHPLLTPAGPDGAGAA